MNTASKTRFGTRRRPVGFTILMAAIGWVVTSSAASFAQMHDASFGNSGVAELNVGVSNQLADMTVAPDGSIYVLGDAYAGANRNLLVARFGPDGQLDATFGGLGSMAPGTVVLDVFGDDKPGAIRVLDDGKILVSCYNTAKGVELVRLTNEGHYDVEFGENHSGVVDVDAPLYSLPGKLIGNHLQAVVDMEILDNKIYLLTQAGLVCCNLDGSRDPSYGINGMVRDEATAGTDAILERMCVENSRLILIGYHHDLDHNDELYSFSRMIGLTADGQTDASFGNQGVLDLPHFIHGESCAIEVNGGIITAAAGQHLVQMNFQGVLRANFSNNGIVETFPEGVITDIELMTHGRIAATVLMPGMIGDDFSIVRFLPDGSLDPAFSFSSFGADQEGWVAHKMGHAGMARRLFGYANGKLLAGGDFRYNAPEDTGGKDIVLMRLNESSHGGGNGNGGGGGGIGQLKTEKRIDPSQPAAMGLLR